MRLRFLVYTFSLLLLKVKFMSYSHHLEAQISDPTSDLMNQNMRVGLVPRGIVCPLNWETHCSLKIDWRMASHGSGSEELRKAGAVRQGPN